MAHYSKTEIKKLIAANPDKDAEDIINDLVSQGHTLEGMTMRGLTGKEGPIGPRGPTGKDGPQGPKGDSIIGPVGSIGPEGPVGKEGPSGNEGAQGSVGKDGSPDTGEQIVDKINEVPEEGPKIDAKHIKNLPANVQTIVQGIRGGGNAGGGNVIELRDEGIRISTNVRAIDFIGAGVSIARIGDGIYSVTIPGGGGNFADNETPAGTLDGTNLVFTLANTPSPVASLSLYLNGQLQTSGTDFTISGVTITMTLAPTSGEILRTFYRY